MKIKVIYSKNSLKFLHKNTHTLSKEKVDQLVFLSIGKLLKRENPPVDVKRIVGKENHYRIRVGKIRIIFLITKGGNVTIASVEYIDWRGDVYKR